ncbi:MAG: hypothetical protein LBP59_14980 [Planctomycetaceae bacterium]|jgi:hypothetical protein|nr:hypothetical protein [Planctomycetaceae bacterium]
MELLSILVNNILQKTNINKSKTAKKPRPVQVMPLLNHRLILTLAMRKKNHEKHYGYKNHVVADVYTKIIVNYTVTHAAVHDSGHSKNSFV